MVYKIYIDREDYETPYLILYNDMACWIHECELTENLIHVVRRDSRLYDDTHVEADLNKYEFLGEFEDLDALKMLAIMEM